LARSTTKARTRPGTAAGSNARSGQLLVDDLASQIQARMVTGEIPVGSWLRQERLAAEYGVSRTPIREAIRKLQASGAVEMVPHRGALVRGPSLRDILESYMVRAELEGFAAELAAPMLNEERLQTLRRAETMFEEAAQRFAQLDRDARTATAARDAWIAANDSFHLAVQAAANNDRLLRSIADLHTSFPRSLTSGPLIADPGLLEENVAAHRRIAVALEEHDPAEARRAMREHVLRAGDLVVRWFGRYAGGDGDYPPIQGRR
jgi:DNA-binding GntR family transcriptional regulator